MDQFNFSDYPNTNFNEMNLDFILEEIAKNSADIEEIKAGGIALSSAFVTPEMFGAVGDGIADDTTAFQAACSSAVPICVCLEKYKISDVITVNNKQVIGGEIVFYGNARIDLTNSRMSGFSFDFSNLTRSSITGIMCLGGTVVIENNSFGRITADESGKHIFASAGRIRIKNNTFDVIRVNTPNGIIGDEVGSARHIAAHGVDVLISGNVFEMFDGTDQNYEEDSDAIHLRGCTGLSAVTGNKFHGYAKSCIKVQYGNATITDNYFNMTSGWYCVRWHDSPNKIIVSNNTMEGQCGIPFYTEACDNSIVCGNNVDMACRILLYLNVGKVTFNDNMCAISEGQSLTERELAVFRIVDCDVESNSIITTSDLFKPYHTIQQNSVSVNFSGKIETGYSNSYSLYSATGKINGLKAATMNACQNLEFEGVNCSVVGCENVHGKNTLTSGYTIIRNSTGINIDIYAVNITTYVARINTAKKTVLNLFGGTTSSNIIAVDGGNTSDGVIVNYATNKVGIYDVAGSGVAFVAKSMLI